MFSKENSSKIKTKDPYTKYGECRCCMAKGLHRDVSQEYYCNNIREVYRDIFMECFNLPLSTHKRISPLICSNCVQRLRDATSFRMMAVSSERQMLDAITSKDDMDTLFVGVPDPNSTVQSFRTEIKVEIDTENIDIVDNMDIFGDGFEVGNSNGDYSEEIEYRAKDARVKCFTDTEFAEKSDCKDSDEYNSDYTLSNKDAEPLEEIEGESELMARFPRAVRPLPKRSELLIMCPEYNYHLRKLKDKIVKPKSIEWFFKQPAPKQKSKCVSEKLALAVNTTTLFEHSNATAFKTKMRNGYPCFYCREIFKYDTLIDHQTIHPKSSIYKLLTKYTADEFIVYADITDLKCTICNENMKNLTELKSHLTENHDKKMYLDHPDRVIPFKLKERDFECQICGQKFETFGAVERHMNKHYRNFICEECGAGFITKHRLAVHASLLHRQGDFTCKICKKFFPTQHKYKIHYDGVHRMLKRHKCLKCSEKFIDYFTRAKHLVDVHGEEPILYKCNVCERGFNRKFSLSTHVKRCHLEQRDFKCQFCSYTCYTKTELKEHMAKHNGIRPYQCCVCKKAYSRNKALVLHMRIHNNDRRYSCVVCGLSFVQRGSLKGHMKSRHTDV